MVMHSFKLENYEQWLEEFAALLHVPIKDHSITLSPEVGEGTVLAHTMSPHLSYAVMNFRLRSDLEIYREADGAKGFSLSFNQVEVNKEVRLSADQSIVADKGALRNDIYLSDTRDPMHLKIPAGSTIKRLVIFATHELAARYLSPDHHKKTGDLRHP